MSSSDPLALSMLEKLLAADKVVCVPRGSVGATDFYITHLSRVTQAVTHKVLRDGVMEDQTFDEPAVRIGGPTPSGTNAHIVVLLRDLEKMTIKRDGDYWRLQ